MRILALKWTARAIATDCRCPPDNDLTADLRFVNLGFSRCITFWVADAIAESSSDPAPCVQFAPQEHVAGCVDVVGEGELLVDDLDPLQSRVARVVDGDRLAIDEDLPRVGGVSPRQGVHQRGLAGTVAADEADDLARVQVDGDPVDGVQATERHTDVAQLDERDTRCRARLGDDGTIAHGGRPSSRLSCVRFG